MPTNVPLMLVRRLVGALGRLASSALRSILRWALVGIWRGSVLTKIGIVFVAYWLTRVLGTAVGAPGTAGFAAMIAVLLLLAAVFGTTISGTGK